MKRFLFVYLFFLGAMAFGQGSSTTGNPVVLGRNGYPLPGLTVAICAGQPTSVTPCGGSSLLQTYTTVSLGVTCTLSPLSPGLLNGTGCTNPGLTDGIGNVVAFAPSAYSWCQYYGSGITTYSQPCIFPTTNSGSFSQLAISNTGTFTGSQMNEYLTGVVNGCSTSVEEQLFEGAGIFATSALSGCIYAPSTSTKQNAVGVQGYSRTDTSLTTSVGGLFQAHANANNSLAQGMQSVAMDTAGLTGTLLTPEECDLVVNNADAAYTAGPGSITCTNMVLHFFNGQVGSPPTNYKVVGIKFSAIGGSYNTLLHSADGTANTAFWIGAQSTGGTNPSQVFRFRGISGGVPSAESTINADSAGNLLLIGGGTVKIPSNGLQVGTNGTIVTIHQHKRISTGVMAGTTRAEVLLTWTATFTDTSYTSGCTVEDSATAAAVQGLTFERIRTKSATQVGAIINNPTGGALTGTLDCWADHD